MDDWLFATSIRSLLFSIIRQSLGFTLRIAEAVGRVRFSRLSIVGAFAIGSSVADQSVDNLRFLVSCHCCRLEDAWHRSGCIYFRRGFALPEQPLDGQVIR